MKLETIINVFAIRDKDNQPLILKMLNTIKNFDRKMDLKPPYRELKQINEDYEEERNDYVKKLIKDYCAEVNEKNTDKEGWVELNPDEILRIPATKMDEYSKEIKERVKKEITLKSTLEFYKDEVERARLDFEEEEFLEEFINWTKTTPKKKKSKNKK